MNENTKTVLFAFVAVLVAVIAWAARPHLPGFDEPLNLVNQPLFTEFDKKVQENPLVAASLEVVQFDEQSGRVKPPFKVAQVKTDKGFGAWSIPFHDNYPADAKDHLAEAAASLCNLTVLGVASENPGDFETYGVVDPASKELKPGTAGVGTRVTMRDKDDQVLVDLIVGKEVPGGKDARREMMSQPKELRYVRKAGQDPIYEVAVKTDKLSSNFGDWIEKDLLKMSSWEIKGVQVDDYSVDPVAGAMLQRGQFALEHNDSSDPRWKLTKDETFDEKTGKWVALTMPADEELNTQKLDDMKFALGDLKIVDVNRKPAGLSGNLRGSGTLRKDRSLAQRGFYFGNPRGYEELLSTEGEVKVPMKDGVVYVMRFGQIAGTSGPSPKKEDAKGKTEGKDDKDKSSGVNRYLFVMTEFNRDAIEKPKLDPLPPEPKPGDAKKDVPKKADAKKDEGKKDEATKDDKPDPKAERERIEKENKKKQDEYNEKIKKGEDHVKELNARFADWYYVIPDDTYQKIHLGRKDVTKKKEKKEEEKKADALKGPANSPAELDLLKGAVPAPKTPETPKAPTSSAAPAMPAAPAGQPPAAKNPPAPAKPAPATTPAAPPKRQAAPAPTPPPAAKK